MKHLLNTLYVTNPDAMLRKKDDAILVCVDGEKPMSVPFHVLESIVLFGHVGCSTSLLRACAERGVHIVLLDEHGGYGARIEGSVSGNVLLRRTQYRLADDNEACLAVSKRFVASKIHNQKVVLQHHARDHIEVRSKLESVIMSLGESSVVVKTATTLDELRGVEGNTAHAYFSVFGWLLRSEDDQIGFAGRSRRPPKDPVNAVLSFFYTLLAHDYASACEAVGLDPQMGFLHSCRPGRASLALDLMEELRAPYVDRFVLSLFNKGRLTSRDFIANDSSGVWLKDDTKKLVISVWQQRKQEQVIHPFLKEKVKLGLLPFIQTQLFSRFLRGDLSDYPAYLWR